MIMYVFWDALIKPLLEAVKPHAIVEIGSQHGDNTKNILEYCKQTGAILHAIDPLPTFDVDAWKEQFGDQFIFYPYLSLNALPKVPQMDVVFVDGDHNWYTVYHELKLIEKYAAENNDNFPLVILHDTGWPYGRRDLYYNPENIPALYLKPYQKKGLSPASPELLESGGINQHLYNSIYENSLQSGVLTAVEDFLKETTFTLETVNIFAFNGISLVYPAELKKNNIFNELINSLVNSENLMQITEQLEDSRVKLQVDLKGKETTVKSLQKALQAEQSEKESLQEALQAEQSEKQILREILQKEQGEKKSLRESLQAEGKEKLKYRHKVNNLEIINKDLSQLKKWLEDMQWHSNIILKSKSWKIGSCIGYFSSLLRGKSKISPEYLNLKSVFNEYEGWTPDPVNLENDIDKLSKWIEKVESNYYSLIRTNRWKTGNKIINILRKITFREAKPIGTKMFDNAVNNYYQWKNEEANSSQDILAESTGNKYVTPEEAAGEPYTLRPPLKT